MQSKTDRLDKYAKQVGLNISTIKTQVMCINSPQGTKRSEWVSGNIRNTIDKWACPQTMCKRKLQTNWCSLPCVWCRAAVLQLTGLLWLQMMAPSLIKMTRLEIAVLFLRVQVPLLQGEVRERSPALQVTSQMSPQGQGWSTVKTGADTRSATHTHTFSINILWCNSMWIALPLGYRIVSCSC